MIPNHQTTSFARGSSATHILLLPATTYVMLFMPASPLLLCPPAHPPTRDNDKRGWNGLPNFNLLAAPPRSLIPRTQGGLRSLRAPRKATVLSVESAAAPPPSDLTKRRRPLPMSQNTLRSLASGKGRLFASSTLVNVGCGESSSSGIASNGGGRSHL